MLPLGSCAPVSWIHVRHGARDHHRLAFRDSVLQDPRVFVLGLPDDVDRDVFAKGFRVA